MKIIIKKINDDVVIKESKDCKEHDVINAYAAALAMKCGKMFKKKETALALLEKAYDVSKQVIDDMYDK